MSRHENLGGQNTASSLAAGHACVPAQLPQDSWTPAMPSVPLPLVLLVLLCSARARRLVMIVLAVLVAVIALLLAFAAGRALGEEGGPQWTVAAVSRPTNFKPGDQTGQNAFVVTVTDTGGAASDGTPVEVIDELPEGLAGAAIAASGEDSLTGSQLSCVFDSCVYAGVVVPDDTLTLSFPVNVTRSTPGLVDNVVRVSGGGAPNASMSTPTTISQTPAGFGVSPGGATTALSSVQAGAHPDLTTSIAFNTVTREGALAGDPKDTTDQLPAGFAGDLVDTPSCALSLFSLGECPIGTQIGVTTLILHFENNTTLRCHSPVYNLAPNPGSVSKLGFQACGNNMIQGDVTVNPENYSLTATFHNAPAIAVELDNVSLTIWGVPADPAHNPLRWDPGTNGASGSFGVASDAHPVPFLAAPTVCGGELHATFTVAPWQTEDPDSSASMGFGPLIGCDRLKMSPALTAQPTSSQASSPTGLGVTMSIPQTYENAYGLATSTLQGTTVTLPEGLAVNPSAAAGLAACTQAQYETEPTEAAEEGGCPSQAKVGSVHISTPALAEEAVGSVYVAQPYANQFDSLLALYVVARIPQRGLLIKAAGEVSLNPLTGQLTTTFQGLPPLPFSKLTLSLQEGANAALITPARCGDYTTTAQLSPWSSPSQLLDPAVPAFAISTGPAGSACPTAGPLPLAPQLAAGTQTNTAASYSPLNISITRADGEQQITGISTKLPAGLTANLTGVPFCTEADIEKARTNTGTQEQEHPSCPAATQIGEIQAGAGAGETLAWVPGNLYMAGPFEGAPLSVVAITRITTGPFDLGTVVMHLPLQINPTTAAVTIPNSPTNQIPRIIDGIPVQIRAIHIHINRPHFTLNPTSCNPTRIEAAILGETSTANTSSHYQAADCSNLEIHPHLHRHHQRPHHPPLRSKPERQNHLPHQRARHPNKPRLNHRHTPPRPLNPRLHPQQSLPRQHLQQKPRRLPPRKPRRHRQSHHTTPTRPPHRTRLLRQLRRPKVPRTRPRPPRLRHHHHPPRRNQRHQRHHHQHLQNPPRPTHHHLRTKPPPKHKLRPLSHPKPLHHHQTPPHHPPQTHPQHHPHRPKRPNHPPKHTHPRHQLQHHTQNQTQNQTQKEINQTHQQHHNA